MSEPASLVGSVAAPDPKCWRFGTAVVNERTLELIVAGKVAPLERKSFDVLLLLLRRAGEVVSKEEIFAAVWTGRIVSESVLPKCITYLRAALGDEEQAVIKTVHGVGYRLIAQVTVEAAAQTEATAVSAASVVADAVTHAATLPLSPASGDSTRRLTAVVFTDMVGYSALVHRDERLAMQLLDEHRRLVRKSLRSFGGQEVETAGDGFLLHFPSALGAVRWAVTVQQAHARRNAACAPAQQITIRVGIHLADVEHQGRAVFGDGVNIAARVEPLSPPGGVALSGFVYGQIHNHIQARFRPLGPQTLKNIATPLDVFVLDPDALKQVHSSELPLSPAPRISRHWLWVAIAIAGTVAAIALLVLRPMHLGTRTKSVAVLPFTNLSSDANDRHLADGIQDSVLAKLAGIKDVKVISRTSVMQYRDTQMAIAQIGAALNVAHLVEGSVQRQGGRVRVTAQLIRVADDSHLWADSYDRDMADVFDIQSDIARRVAGAIEAILSPAEQARIAHAPTHSPEAYALYVYAANLEDATDNTPDVLYRIESLLEQALKLDPNFALAYAEMANTHMNWYRGGEDSSPARLERARVAMETALKLDPNLAEAHVQDGHYRYEGLRDYPSAERAFQRAIELNPNSAEAYEFLAFMRMDRSRWADAVKLLERARELDPNHRWIRTSLAHAYMNARRFPDAFAEIRQQEKLATADPGAKLLHPLLQLYQTGELTPLKTAIEKIPPKLDTDPFIRDTRLRVAWAEGRDADAVRIWENCGCPWIAVYPASRYPKELALADALWLVGNRESEARTLYSRAKEILEQEIRTDPDKGRTYEFLGLALAGLGQRDAALAAIEQSLKKVPVSDSYERALIQETLARVLLQFGEYERALDLLTTLARPPGLAAAYRWYHDPWFRTVKNHPKFQQIIRDHDAAVQ